MPVTFVSWKSFAFAILLAATPTILAGDVVAQSGWGNNPSQQTSAGWQDSWSGNNGWIGASSVRNGWKLGVTADNTDAGVVVRRVSPNSAAARVNIVPGDVIVCIDGDQVGRVGNQIFDLGDELNHHADSSGRISLLVYSRRLGQLRPVSVQLQDRSGGLNGTIYIQGGRLPMNSVVTVRLENVSRPYFKVANGEYSFRADSYGVGEIPFQLNYDSRYISGNDTYRLRAFVSAGGRTIYDTANPALVLTQGNPSSVRLTLRSTSNFNNGVGQVNGGGQVFDVGYRPFDSYQQDIYNVYQQHLERAPTSVELAAWHQTHDIENRVQGLGGNLMASQEYFNRVGGSNLLWLRQVFRTVIGHSPSRTEEELWMRRFAELRYSRTELLNQLYMQARG